MLDFFDRVLGIVRFKDVRQEPASAKGKMVLLIHDQVERFKIQFPEIWQAAFRVAAIRNPYERLVSGWKYHPYAKDCSLEDLLEKLPCPDVNPSEIDWKRERPSSEWDLFSAYNHLTATQSDALTADGEIIVHRMLRCENLADDLESLCDELGIKGKSKLKHLNKTKRSKIPAIQHYTPRALDLIHTHFEQDFAKLPYEKVA